MRAVAILAILLVASPFLPILSGGEAKGEGDGTPHGRAAPEITNRSLDITFDRSEYIVWNISGNMTMDITFTSRSGSDENVSVSAWFCTYSSSAHTGSGSSDLDKRTNLLFSPNETKTLQVNISIRPAQFYTNGRFFRMIYVVAASGGHIQSRNYTTVSSLGPYSLKIVDPAPNMGDYHVLVDASLDVRLNVTNYSDSTLDGSIQGYYNSKNISVGPKSSAMISITIGPFPRESQEAIVFSIYANLTSTLIGYDRIDDHATNITDSYITVKVQRLLYIGIADSYLKLAEPGQINVSILSCADYTIRNLRFNVVFTGWLNDRISHRGEFTVARIEPQSIVNVSYDITSLVAGRFNMVVSTTINGERFSDWNYDMTIASQAGPSMYPNITHHGDRTLGEREFLNGTITKVSVRIAQRRIEGPA